MATMKTWLCPGCGATTDSYDRVGACPQCAKHIMVLHNIHVQAGPPPQILIGEPDIPVARWLEDRAETECGLCNQPLTQEPQGFVALILKPGFTFAVMAACERCALAEAA